MKTKSKIDHFGAKEQNRKLPFDSCVMYSQHCAMNARHHVYSEKQTMRDKLELNELEKACRVGRWSGALISCDQIYVDCYCAAEEDNY